MTEEMPPSRLVGPMTAILRTWWNQEDERWRAAVKATTFIQRTPPPPPYYRALLSLASDLISGQYELRHELAIAAAQMACEVVVEQTLTPLLKGKKPPKNFNLAGGKGGALETYKKLTDDRSITKKPFWTPFVHHADLRNKIVHAGKRVGQADAEKSLSVATQFVDHVENVRGEALR